MNTVNIIQFPVEKTYNKLLANLIMAFVVISFLVIFGITAFWEFFGLYLVFSYAIGLIILAIVIYKVESELKKQLETRFILAQFLNRIKIQTSIFSFSDIFIYSVICPFCNTYMEINQSSTLNIPKFNAQYPFFVHYRELRLSRKDQRYARFVNPRNLKVQ